MDNLFGFALSGVWLFVPSFVEKGDNDEDHTRNHDCTYNHGLQRQWNGNAYAVDGVAQKRYQQPNAQPDLEGENKLTHRHSPVLS